MFWCEFVIFNYIFTLFSWLFTFSADYLLLVSCLFMFSAVYLLLVSCLLMFFSCLFTFTQKWWNMLINRQMTRGKCLMKKVKCSTAAWRMHAVKNYFLRLLTIIQYTYIPNERIFKEFMYNDVKNVKICVQNKILG